MKILVTMDNSGHFNAAHPSDRNNTIELIKTIEDGEYFENISNDYDLNLPSDLSTMCCQDWDDFIQNFTQRGTLEYVQIPDIIPKSCACE